MVHVHEVAKKEVCLGVRELELAPAVRFGDEAGEDFVEFLHGVVFSFHHRPGPSAGEWPEASNGPSVQSLA